MAYTPINWQTGDTITADKLNKMDNGWSVQSTQLFSETGTTVSGEYGNEGNLTYTEQVSYSTIIVVFNNTAYTCNRVLVNENTYGYGGVDEEWNYDFNTYPFALVFSKENGNIIATGTAGTYTVSVTAKPIETSDDFTNAVKKIVNPIPMRCISGVTTYDEMVAATDSGSLLYFYSGSQCHFIVSYLNSASPTAVNALPAGVSDIETYGFNDDMVFTIYQY